MPRQAMIVAAAVLVLAAVTVGVLALFAGDGRARPPSVPLQHDEAAPAGGVSTFPTPSRPHEGPRAATRARLETDATSDPVPTAESGPLELLGTVVTWQERDIVPGALVRAVLEQEGSLMIAVSAIADSGGRFSLGPKSGDYSRAWLHVDSGKGAGDRELEVTGTLRGRRDLGEVELGNEVRRIWFRVVSASGAPVPGAVALAAPHRGYIENADADGAGSIDVDPDAVGLRFGAFGFEPAFLPIAEAGEFVTVRLAAACVLTVSVSTPAGDPLPDRVTVRISGTDFPLAMRPSDPLWKATGNPEFDVDLHTDLYFRGTSVRLSPVRRDAEITVAASETSVGVEASEVVRLTTGESRPVKLVLPGEHGRLFGRVVAGDDRAIEGVTVSIGKTGGTYRQAVTDADGRFEFGAVPAQATELRVNSPRHAFWVAPEHVIRPHAEALLIRIDEGVSLRVRVVGPDGAPFMGARVNVADRSGKTGVDGEVLLEHVPRGRIRVVVSRGPRLASIEHDAATGLAVIELPVPVR